MDTKLKSVNQNLARIVFAVAAIFSVSVTLLATMTGEILLLGGTAFGLAAGGYAMQIIRQPSGQLFELKAQREIVAA
ncbi:MAG TPA: hypothetical protein VMS74_11010 [Acidimicrobiia bacterium]|nr:hypothetical protein [Acidimicrobiia bacterium]